jgi:hypothetical protein
LVIPDALELQTFYSSEVKDSDADKKRYPGVAARVYGRCVYSSFAVLLIEFEVKFRLDH